jgi:enoyl-CoA hydratase/carnithine racemase
LTARTDTDPERTVATCERDGILVITLNRPRKANARNQSMQSGLQDAVRMASEREQIRAVVMTGAGSRAFCGGMDLTEVRPSNDFGRTRSLSDFALYDAMETCPKPIIAAVNGAAVGGGLDLVLAADLAVAEKHATFCCPETRLGLVPLFAMLRLPYAIGPQRAAAMVLCSRTIDADQALAWGLVDDVVETGASLEKAINLAKALAGLSREAVKCAKWGLKQSASDRTPRNQAIEVVSQLFAAGAMNPRESSAGGPTRGDPLTGRIYSFSVVHRGVSERFQARTPYVLALVDLDGGGRVLSNVVDSPAERLEIGAPVKAVLGEDPEGRQVVQFTLAEVAG